MPTYEWTVPADVDIDPCPQGCGGLTDDPYGGPCSSCWAELDHNGTEEDDQDG